MMNGSGCKNCPVKPCNTLYYRGSYCAEQRAKFGLGDPMTNGEKIRAMSDRELSEFVGHASLCQRIQRDSDWCENRAVCSCCVEDWLGQPWEDK